MKKLNCSCGAPASLRYCLIENWNKVIEAYLCAKCAASQVLADQK